MRGEDTRPMVSDNRMAPDRLDADFVREPCHPRSGNYCRKPQVTSGVSFISPHGATKPTSPHGNLSRNLEAVCDEQGGHEGVQRQRRLARGHRKPANRARREPRLGFERYIC